MHNLSRVCNTESGLFISLRENEMDFFERKNNQYLEDNDNRPENHPVRGENRVIQQFFQFIREQALEHQNRAVDQRNQNNIGHENDVDRNNNLRAHH